MDSAGTGVTANASLVFYDPPIEDIRYDLFIRFCVLPILINIVDHLINCLPQNMTE